MALSAAGACANLDVEAAIRFGVPKVFLRLVVLVSQIPGLTGVKELGALEICAGKARITKALRARGCCAVPYDNMTISPSMDLLTPLGFALAVRLVLSLGRGALLWLAPPCSSWVWVNRATSGRNQINWEGKKGLKYVAEANRFVSRMALLLWIASYKGVVWVVEQPQSSVMGYHKRLQEIFRALRVHEARVSLGAFRAPTRKNLRLWSQAMWIGELTRYKAPSTFAERTACRRINKHGFLVTDGNQKKLKQSQAYTRKFGRVVAALFLAHREKSVEEQARGGEREGWLEVGATGGGQES